MKKRSVRDGRGRSLWDRSRKAGHRPNSGKRSLAFESLEPRQLLNGVSFTANAFELIKKAQPDEWYVGQPGGPYPVYTGPTPPAAYPNAIPKVNYDYAWSVTQAGDHLWWGVAANARIIASGGNRGPNDKIAVAEMGASTYPGIPRAALQYEGDWRPPRMYHYNMVTGDYQEFTLPSDRLIKQTLGLRSAGSTWDPVAKQGVVIFAGPNQYMNAVNFFAFIVKDTGSGTSIQYYGSTSISGYGDIRGWANYNNQLYTGVLQSSSRTGQGAVLRWTGTLQRPLSFSKIATLDAEGASICVSKDSVGNDRLFVGTWPLTAASYQGALGRVGTNTAGIYMSPVLTSAGLTSSSSSQWKKVWSITQFEPDSAIVRSIGMGPVTSFDGWLYFGTMQQTGDATRVLSEKYPNGYADPQTQVGVSAFVATNRPAMMFRAKNLDTATPQVELLYGNDQFWTYTPTNSSGTTGVWAKKNNKMMPYNGYTPWGGSGFGNSQNKYIWSGRVHGGQLYVGTLDQSIYGNDYVTYAGDMDQVNKNKPARMGADLWTFPSGGAQPYAISQEGVGDPLNHGVRNMVSTPYGLFLGTANASNLLTKPYNPPTQPLKPGGWEIVKVVPVAGTVLDDITATTLDLPGQDLSAGDLWYQVHTTVDAAHLKATADLATVHLALYEDSRAAGKTPAALSQLIATGAQLDWQCGAGKTYYLKMSGPAAGLVDLQIVDTP